MTQLKIPTNGTLNVQPRTTYYDNITRTSDLLVESVELSHSGNTLVKPNYYIAPSPITFDNLVTDILYELDKAIQEPIQLPAPETILSTSLIDILTSKPATDKGTAPLDTFQDHLQRSGYSGTLIKVASDINAARIEAFTRTVLSKTGIFFYLAYRTIEGNGIKDASGIASNILASIGLIKSFVNIALIGKVLKAENLEVTQIERTKIRNYFQNREIPYAPGKPTQVIEEFFVSLKKGGSLYGWVRNFVYSDRVNLPRGTNKDELIHKMVDYLLSIGYVYETNIDNDTSNGDNSTVGNGTTESTPPTADNFKIIEGVGPATEKKFLDAGIYRLLHLADLNNERLKLILKEKGTTDYTDIIHQAKLIVDGKFEELVTFQKNLNK